MKTPELFTALESAKTATDDQSANLNQKIRERLIQWGIPIPASNLNVSYIAMLLVDTSGTPHAMMRNLGFVSAQDAAHVKTICDSILAQINQHRTKISTGATIYNAITETQF